MRYNIQDFHCNYIIAFVKGNHFTFQIIRKETEKINKKNENQSLSQCYTNVGTDNTRIMW